MAKLEEKFDYICVVCGKKDKSKTSNKKYCSRKCYNKWIGQRTQWQVPSGTVGAIQEFRVSVDLLSKGYEVFRALSPSASCDLLILKENFLKKIEVRTGYRGLSGKLIFPKTRHKIDFYAICLPDEIIYIPELKI